MSHRKFSLPSWLSLLPRRLSWLVAGLVLAAATGLAQTDQRAGFREYPQPFEATLQPGEVVGNEQVIRQFIRYGTNQFVFVVPPGLRSQAVGPETLTLESRTGAFSITLRLLGPGPGNSDPQRMEARKEGFLNRCPGAHHIETFTAAVGGREARGVVLRHKPPGTTERLRRVLWLPCRPGVLEFSLDADASQAKTALQALDGVLLTFRSNERGKIEIVPRSDQT